MSERAAAVGATGQGERERRSMWRLVFSQLLRRKPLGLVGLILVAALFLTGIFSELDWMGLEGVGIAPHGYNEINMGDRLAPAGGDYPLGADHLGRDILSRVIHGARLSMIVGVVATVLSLAISTTIGMTSAYFGGWFDLIVQRIVDAWICFPGLVILITLMSIFQPGMTTILLVLGVSSGIAGGRFARSLVFAIKEAQFITAAEAMGARPGRILVRHLLPNILPMLIVLFTIGMGANIMAEASLSFLGLGIPPPFPTWGGMISGEGRRYMIQAPGIAVWPGIALTLAVFGINMLGDALRDLLDPRLRGGQGSYRLDKVDKARRKMLEKAGGAGADGQPGSTVA